MAILFITSTRIGDAALSTGLLKHLADIYPDDAITVACGAPAAPVFETAPRVDRIHVVKKRERGLHWLDLWRATWGTRWRVIVDLRRSALPWLLRADRRAVKPRSDEPIHRVELIGRTLGCGPQAPHVWIGEEHRRQASQLLGDGPSAIAVAPGANWVGKTWPAARFSELARRLTAKGGLAESMRVLVVGADEERELLQPVLDTLGPGRAIDGVGIGLLATYAAIERCHLFIGNDSGLMHLAASTGRPTVGLFGPSDERLYAPWGGNGLVVRTPESFDDLVRRPDYDYRNAGCMMGSLTVDAVTAAIEGRWSALPR